jgi:hypothetical protein
MRNQGVTGIVNFLPGVGILRAMAVKLYLSLPSRLVADGKVFKPFAVAGFQFYDGPSLIFNSDQDRPSDNFNPTKASPIANQILTTGTQLQLCSEPDNAQDPFAVKINLGNRHLGYVPRTISKNVRRLLHRNNDLRCQITHIDPADVPWRMVYVMITVED